VGFSAGAASGVNAQYTPFLRRILKVAIIIASLSPEVREPTVLESYLCRTLSFTLLAFGLLVVILTGSVPMTVSTTSTLSLIPVFVESKD